MPVIQPKPEFVSLTETDIEAALADPDPNNPIAVEVARLMTGYAENFRAHVERLGRLPGSFPRINPGSAIEAVAMRLTTEVIRDELQVSQ